MGAQNWREYPHETALRLKREAAEALYDALESLEAVIGADLSGMSFDSWMDAVDAIEEARAKARDALAQARGEVSVHTLEGGL